MGNEYCRKLLPWALRSAALFALLGAGSQAAAAYQVCLQPLGQYDAGLLKPMGRGLGQVYGFSTRVLPARELPAAAWYEPRKRYRAERLLDHLRVLRRANRGCDTLLGFTAVDISATNGKHADWGVLGLSYRQDGLSVVSSFRMRAGAPRRRVVIRAVKVAAHEVGHAIGLPHRRDGAECLMNDARGAIASIDRARGPLCAGEREAAEALLGFALPRRATLDWDAIREK